jgi:hypothetical protein
MCHKVTFSEQHQGADLASFVIGDGGFPEEGALLRGSGRPP